MSHIYAKRYICYWKRFVNLNIFDCMFDCRPRAGVNWICNSSNEEPNSYMWEHKQECTVGLYVTFITHLCLMMHKVHFQQLSTPSSFLDPLPVGVVAFLPDHLALQRFQRISKILWILWFYCTLTIWSSWGAVLTAALLVLLPFRYRQGCCFLLRFLLLCIQLVVFVMSVKVLV